MHTSFHEMMNAAAPEGTPPRRISNKKILCNILTRRASERPWGGWSS